MTTKQHRVFFGSEANVVSAEMLEQLRADGVLPASFEPSQLTFGGAVALVVGSEGPFGDESYRLENIPGLWPASCLRPHLQTTDAAGSKLELGDRVRLGRFDRKKMRSEGYMPVTLDLLESWGEQPAVVSEIARLDYVRVDLVKVDDGEFWGADTIGLPNSMLFKLP